jgi:branched-chain amino acid transport system substrate-binding protein
MLPSKKFLRVLAFTIALSAATAGCGLKPEATDSLKTANNNNGAAGTSAGTTGAPNGVTGSAPGIPGVTGGGPAGPGVATGSGAGGANTGGAGTGGATTSGSTQAAGGSVACGTPHGGSTTGVTAGTINIGLHAPLTGTGTPFPNSSFQKGAGVFWTQPGHTVCGRKVTVEFQDDQYTPAHARQVCSAMAQRDFMVVGGGGTDQIQACATEPTIHEKNVPYLSAGVTDNGLTGLSNYFAVSLTYKQQGGLVLRNAQTQGFASPAASNQPSDNIKGQNAKWAIVTANTPNFYGARDGMKAALDAAHIPYKDFSKQVNQNGNYQAAATQFGQTLAQEGFKTIFVDAAPGWFVFMTGGYYSVPTAQANWVGPGVTYTEVTVAQYICSGSKNAVNGHAWFLAPAPGLDHATADFKKAYSGSYDDIEWALWGLSNTLWSLLKDASANLTRENFITSTEAQVVPSNPYVPVDFKNHGGHFGGTGAWVQKVNCAETEPDQNQAGGWDTVGSTFMRLY